MRQMFNEAQKAEIVAEAKVRPQREIAEERGCSPSTISRIVNEDNPKQSSSHRTEEIQMGNTQPITIKEHKTTTTTQTVTVSADKATITRKVTTSTRTTTTSTHAPMSTIYSPAVNVLQQQEQQNMLTA